MEGTNLLHSVLCENLCQKREKGTKSKSIIELIPCIKNIYSFLVTKKVLIRFWLINRHRLLLLFFFFFSFFFFRKGLKAIFALLPLLGVTFLLGFFVDFYVTVEYAFVLLNSIQVNYCVRQSKDIVVVMVAFRVNS